VGVTIPILAGGLGIFGEGARVFNALWDRAFEFEDVTKSAWRVRWLTDLSRSERICKEDLRK